MSFLSASKHNYSAFLHRVSFENLEVIREGFFDSCNGVYCFIEFVFVELIESIRKSLKDSRIPRKYIALRGSVTSPSVSSPCYFSSVGFHSESEFDSVTDS
jgi:hypothetical protein